MTKPTLNSAWTPIIFILNILIIAPIGFVVSEYTKEHRAFKDRAVTELREQRRSASETREEQLKNTATIKAQANSIKQLRARLDRLERLFYEYNKRP